MIRQSGHMSDWKKEKGKQKKEEMSLSCDPQIYG